MSKFPSVLWLAAALVSLAGCGSGELPVTTPPVTATGTAAVLILSASPAFVQTDNLPTTVTVQALTATNAAVPNAVVALSADTGVVNPQTVTTDSNGSATFTFASGLTDKANRTATITATAGGTAQLQIPITGSSLTASTTGTTIPDNGSSPVTVTFNAKDVNNAPISGAAISVGASTPPGGVTLTATSGTTDASGNFTVSVAGTTAGTVTLTGSAVGATAAVVITVSTTAATFGISQTQLNSDPPVPNPTAVSMQTPDSLTVTVSAPSSTNVWFTTSQGAWLGGNTFKSVAVAAGAASAVLTTTTAGVASVQVSDPANNALNDTISVSMTSVTPDKINLQASPSVIPKSGGATTGVSTLIATVNDANGLPVGNQPVAFSIVNPTGGGETVSPVVVYTASTATSSLGLGEARTSFTSGSRSSGQNGVQIRAQVLNTTVVTEAAGVNATASGNDAAVVIGGTAGSVAFGTATVLAENTNKTAYIKAMSVIVADSSGNPASGAVVSLSIWPIAWSTGVICSPDPDGYVWDPTAGGGVGAYVVGNGGTFFSEDINENVNLDAGEDGRRFYFDTNTIAPSAGTLNTLITPPNSASGTIPSTVTTDANGVATFSLTYGKNSAIWTAVRIRARTIVQGSDAVGEITFRLPALEADASTTVCRLPDSPYNF